MRADVGGRDGDRDQQGDKGACGSDDEGSFAGGCAVVAGVVFVLFIAVDIANSWQPTTLCWVTGRGIIIF